MAQKEEPLKIAVVGVGHMGQYHVNVLSGLTTHELVCVYDADLDRGLEIASKYDVPHIQNYEEILEQVEAVVVSVPTEHHFEFAKQALEKGKHVLVEKPITVTMEQAKELVEIASEKDLILQVGHVERFNGAVIELNKIVTEPRYLEAKRVAPFSDRIKDVGVVLDILIHDLDIVLNLVKSRVKSFHAYGSSVFSNNEDVATITLYFENGAIANLLGSRINQNKERLLSVSQDKSTIHLNYANQDIEIYRQASTAYLMTPDQVKYSQESFVEKLYVHKDNPLRGEHMHFYDCIRNNQTPMVSNDKDLETLRIAIESLAMINKQRAQIQ